MKVKIAVLGAGANGLASAVKIQEAYKHAEVVIVSNEFSPDTTADGSGGLWYPYLCGSTSENLLAKWGAETYNFLHEIWFEGGNNVCLIPFYEFYRDIQYQQPPKWLNSVFGYHQLNETQLNYYSKLYNVEFRSGMTFLTFVLHPSSLLKYFTERFKCANGKILRAEITSLDDPLLTDFDVVVNCTGLGARNLVPDSSVFPIRGQISKVIAPWVNAVIVEDGGNYIIPNTETCVLGGTHQEHDYNTKINDTDTDFIHNGCRTIIPGLEHAKLVRQWVGLRPGRHEIRLDHEVRNGKLVIHNYGHGGSGLTLFWGCAQEVVDILKNKTPIEIKHSKL
ncbi:D-amino-acid oxidase isoform X1 [Ostrinia nubilalis]|uniref:D-amino-acid oxidase isoform X1 n=1 Tax=Ostrinia nubilalis TaxID=29057 RepID=UPI0030822338